MRFGVLVEDRTDGDAMRVLIQRLVGSNVKVKPRCGKGCARMRSKAKPHMRELANDGYTSIIILHDLDRNDEGALRRDLEAID
jgi:hypothetical protein